MRFSILLYCIIGEDEARSGLTGAKHTGTGILRGKARTSVPVPMCGTALAKLPFSIQIGLSPYLT